MAVSVKRKIWFGTFFLFLLLLLTGGVGIFYMAKLKTESENVLKANYESLAYSHTMQQQLNNLGADPAPAIKIFEETLQKQENNITEHGEDKATADLRKAFNQLKAGDSSRKNIQAIENSLQTILFLNMQAIQRKSKAAEKTADDALTIIISLGGLVFLIALSFLINFPSVVTTPINRLAEAIKEIANKNYSHRIHIDNKDEFGKLADAFNEMAERLQYFENSNLNKLLFEKSRAEAVINSLKDASIGIGKNNNVLFANEQALQLLGLRAEEVVGKAVEDLKKKNDLFHFLMDKDATAPFKIVVDNRENYFVKEIIEVAQGDVKNKVIVLKNITSFKELDVAKTNFIATISHELKTPLAASDFSLKLLEDERTGLLSAEQKELVESLKHDNQRMLKILSELLNMSQVEAGRIQLNIRSVSPATIIENAVQTVAGNAKEKEIEIKNAVSILNKTGEAAQKAGLKFAYHNHDAEFKTIDGTVPYHAFLTDTDPQNVKLELDLAWAIKGGADPVELFQQHPGRFPLWHVKDLDASRNTILPVGKGTIDFARIFKAADSAGLQYYFVEHDMPKDGFASITESIANLKKLTA